MVNKSKRKYKSSLQNILHLSFDNVEKTSDYPELNPTIPIGYRYPYNFHKLHPFDHKTHQQDGEVTEIEEKYIIKIWQIDSYKKIT